MLDSEIKDLRGAPGSGLRPQISKTNLQKVIYYVFVYVIIINILIMLYIFD